MDLVIGVKVATMSDEFVCDYFRCRALMRSICEKRRFELEELEIEARGPGNEPLCIQIATVGPRTPTNALLHFSGLHGVEGFTGSAIQRKILSSLENSSSSTKFVFFHCVNPYGMAWYRRTNESNVDLNRNFLIDEEVYSGSPDGYGKLEGLLNPRNKPLGKFAFWSTVAWHVARTGMPKLKEATVGGQYDYPDGLFFGGHRQEESTRLVFDWVSENLRDTPIVNAIDVHTGLGEYSKETVLAEYLPSDQKFRDLASVLGSRLQSIHSGDQGGQLAYSVKGSMIVGLEKAIGSKKSYFVVQEFGTLSVMRVLKALIDENYNHHFGEKDRKHPAKLRLLEAFCPHDESWQKKVVERGCQLFNDFRTKIP